MKVAGMWRLRARREDAVAAFPLDIGAPEGIRTPNLLIRSQMLYPLSYGRLCLVVQLASQLGGGERI